jgi:hypothetical protein
MKKLTLVFFLSSFGFAWAQNAHTPKGSFEIIGNKSPEKAEFFTESIAKADLESYRLKSTCDTLEFKNGFSVVLLSAKEMYLKGINVNVNSYNESRSPKVPLPLFVVFDNGWLGAEVKSVGKSHSK